MTTYADFLDRRTQLGEYDGFDPNWIPDFLFGWQTELVEWAIRKGRSAIFADCGPAAQSSSSPPFTPFMGVGSEVYSAVRHGRRGVGVELKPSYYRQAVKNLAAVNTPEADLLPFDTSEEEE